ncbi:LANO_0H23354g1_1 [Lachancea nothofagi CBS 11611]|uniref:LANO_0H23354g1_1 n=1 Tax=Lachancea nothofagi CBS 11611 TaxID=1266666 RepID=A0A1G4KNY8_9SACH|nr:LANO_0H23354g1_1 [Lachancea nothofagi CBS 11611]
MHLSATTPVRNALNSLRSAAETFSAPKKLNINSEMFATALRQSTLYPEPYVPYGFIPVATHSKPLLAHVPYTKIIYKNDLSTHSRTHTFFLQIHKSTSRTLPHNLEGSYILRSALSRFWPEPRQSRVCIRIAFCNIRYKHIIPRESFFHTFSYRHAIRVVAISNTLFLPP